MGIQIPQSTFEAIPTGEYAAKVVGIEQVTGQYGEQLKVKFEITDPAHTGATLSAWCGMSFNPKSKLYSLAAAAFAAPIPPDYVLDTDDLIGKGLRIVVVEKTKPDGATFSKVDGFKPRKVVTAPANGNGARRVPAPPPAPMAEDNVPF